MAETTGGRTAKFAPALERYAALTGNAIVSLDDPNVRRFCEAFVEAAEAAEAVEIPLRRRDANLES